MSTGKACVSRDRFLFIFNFLSLDFDELWCTVTSACLFTEIKWQWAMLVEGWMTASVHYLYL